MLTIGDTLPTFSLKAVKGGAEGLKLATAFTDLTDKSDAGKWKVIFFWPKDFTFVCPTEIVAFGKLAEDFADRDAVVYGASIDSEFVHLNWRLNHADLKDLPIPMIADIKRELSAALGILDKTEGVGTARDVHRRSRWHHPLRLGERPVGRPQSGRSDARARRAAERRAVPVQLEQGRRGPAPRRLMRHREARPRT